MLKSKVKIGYSDLCSLTPLMIRKCQTVYTSVYIQYLKGLDVMDQFNQFTSVFNAVITFLNMQNG